MAVRIRKDNKTILCAAKSEAVEGDTYIDDQIHYILGAEMRVMSVYGYTPDGCDLWEFHSPISGEEKIDKQKKAMSNIVTL